MKTIILGVGNPILSDDGVGLHVIQQLKKCIKNPQIHLDEALTGGMNLLDLLIGYDKAIIIDAVKANNGGVGMVEKFHLEDFSTIHSCNPHDVSLQEAITMAKKLGEDQIPKEIIIIGILMKNIPCEFSEKLSKKIEMAVPKAVEMTLKEIEGELKISG
ncbi:MAG: hydrogenase maturation protease [Candidatus Thermoplasmatota archaeon]|nr:hydrogenase maturation protease [Candidatus Thermoplasmatota archaeon]